MVFKGWLGQILRILRLWTRREITSRYAGSLIGVLWALLLPLGNIFLFYFVFAVILKVRVPELAFEQGYFFYLLAGLLPWMGLAEGITRAAYSLVTQEQLLQKIAFPVAVLPIAAVLASLLPQLIGMLIFIGMLALFGLLKSSIFELIPLLFCQLAMTCGLGLLLAVLAVGFRDLLHLVPIFVQFLFYATPILYPYSMVPVPYQTWFLFNPFAVLVAGYHAAFLGLPFSSSCLIALLVWTSLLGGGGLWLFRALRGALGDWL